MRFSIAALVALAAGATATQYTTEVVTHYTTYCPEATSVVHGGQTYSMSTPGTLTMSNGPYTVTRPLMTSTVTQCNACSSTPVATSTPVVAPTSTPYVPSSSATATPSASPVYNSASRAASGAGAGLAAIFGAAALLL